MSAAVSQHPAVAIAMRVVHRLDTSTVPVAVLARDEIAAVLLDSDDHRLVVFVPHEHGDWVAPGMTSGTPRRMREQQEHRTGQEPLTGMSRRMFVVSTPHGDPETFGWFAVTGQAAADALEVTVTSSVETIIEPIHKNGLAFALVRIRAGEQPEIRYSRKAGSQ